MIHLAQSIRPLFLETGRVLFDVHVNERQKKKLGYFVHQTSSESEAKANLVCYINRNHLYRRIETVILISNSLRCYQKKRTQQFLFVV